jgi:urease beta subunit
VTGKVSGSVLLATWDEKFAIKTQELRPLSDGSLQVTTHTHFTDNSGRLDYDSKDIFAKGLVHDWSEPKPK